MSKTVNKNSSIKYDIFIWYIIYIPYVDIRHHVKELLPTGIFVREKHSRSCERETKKSQSFLFPNLIIFKGILNNLLFLLLQLLLFCQIKPWENYTWNRNWL